MRMIIGTGCFINAAMFQVSFGASFGVEASVNGTDTRATRLSLTGTIGSFQEPNRERIIWAGGGCV